MNALLSDEGLGFDKEISVEVRVLHGAQAGSSLLLLPGEYLLGSGGDCALILSGPNVAQCHAMLKFDGETAFIEPVDGIVRDAYGAEIIAGQELVLGSPVEMGGVMISLDHDDAPWPDPYAMSPASRAGVLEKDDDDGADGDGLSAPAASQQATVLDSTFSTVAPGGPRWRRRLWICFLMLGVVGALVAMWVMPDKTLITEKRPAIVGQPIRDEQPPAAAVAVLKSYPDANLSMKKEAAGWRVGGYVATASQQRSLSSALAAAAPEVAFGVLAEDELVQSTKTLLAGEDLGAYVKVESAVQGVVRLAGAAASTEAVQGISQLLMKSVPGVVDVKADFLLPEQLRRKLKERLNAAGLAERLIISSQGAELKLIGRLTPDEIRRWEEMLLAFGRDYGNVLPIRATITRIVPKPPVGVQVIVGGAMPYIVTQSGEHVNQGGSVDGHTLMSIKEGEVVFEGNQRIRIAR